MEQHPFQNNQAFPNKIKNVPVLDSQTGVQEIIKCDFDFKPCLQIACGGRFSVPSGPHPEDH